MIVLAAIIIVLCSSRASGTCPNGALPTIVVPYQQASSGDPNDAAIRTYFQNSKTYFAQYVAVSCKQIAELKPHYDSGYYWIKGVSGASCGCLL